MVEAPLKGEQQHESASWTGEEESLLREAIGEEEWPMIAVAINTGLRQGEQFRLRWEHVDFANGVLTVPRSKHGETRRISDELRRCGKILRSLPEPPKEPVRLSERNRRDTNQYRRTTSTGYSCPRCEKPASQGFRWHDLRHTFASRLVMAGVDFRTVQELMGHKTIHMTMRYSHLSPAAPARRGTAFGRTSK